MFNITKGVRRRALGFVDVG